MSIQIPTARLVTATLCALLLTSMAPPGGAAAAESYPSGTRIQPAALEAGPATPLLHVERSVIVDGARRIRVAAAELFLLGRSGRHYVVAASNANFERWRVLRVTPAGQTRRIVGGPRTLPDLMLSDDGSHVAWSSYVGNRGVRIRIVDTRTGGVLRDRTFAGQVAVLDYGPRRVFLSQGEGRTRTFSWDPHTNAQTRISALPAYSVDVRADRLGLLLGDPYQGGCQKVVPLSAPATTLWRSCTDIAFSFSPTGRRMVTGHILSDGGGPTVIQNRGARGRVLETYRARWFGFLQWESDRRLVLAAAGRDYAAAVRCTDSGCVRASRLYALRGRDPWLVMAWRFPS